jgi:hypothetical protein
MVDARDLLDEWEEGGTGLRPARAQALRADLMEHTGMYMPHRRTELESYLTRMRSQITRKLREAVEASEDAE